MSQVRVLVGTKKGAFVISSDGARKDWTVEGPFFGGWEIYHMKGSPANPDRIWASQSTSWHGQVVRRSDDGGKTWETVGNDFQYEGTPGTHKWYDGSPHPWEFARVWHFEPSLDDPDAAFAGVEDAALFRTLDGGSSWQEVSSFRNQVSASEWTPGAGGMALHTILLDPVNLGTIYGAVSAAGVFKSEDDGKSWALKTNGLKSEFLPDPEAPVGHCVHRIAHHRDAPSVLYMQKHWDVMKSDDGGDNWYEISGNLPTDFGFVVGVNSNDKDTVYVIPIKSDSEHYPLEGKLTVYRSKVGGNEWEPLTKGLPQKDCYVNVLRDALAIDDLDSCGIYFGTTGGHVFVSSDSGDSWMPIAENLPSVLSVEVQTLP